MIKYVNKGKSNPKLKIIIIHLIVFFIRYSFQYNSPFAIGEW